MRHFLIGIIVLIVVVVGALLWGVANIDGIVKTAIEENGSATTGTDVTVESVAIALTEGRASINVMTIANPEGYSDDNAIALEQITATFDPSTTRDIVVMDTFRIEKPVVIYETGPGGSNIDVLQRRMKSPSSQGSPNANSANRSAVAEPKFIINTLVITKGKLKIKSGQDKIGSSDIPAIRLKNVGKAEGGLTGGEIGEIVVNAISDKTLEMVTQGAIEKYLDDVTDKIKGIFD